MIRSFSFRYGDNTGKQEWYRVEDDGKAICVRMDMRDEEEHTFYAEVEGEFLKELEEKLEVGGIVKWNGFYDIETCLCSGDSWVLHIFYTDGKEDVHAMGHSARPDGFETGVRVIKEIFARFL
ncbi:hypothetical protein [Anaerotignum sp. MB30-C6]|uniref:hypothetical protein n=1 Tax=Anaerotignum sp. MB30-C6 TaxID=3070814 RepID=UPI0027DBCBA2|nr:hypothetical protein [Anaerotignum sp. MB30-C6]WMI80437.1 hypothetical protein RBQ60_11440 [Anaerotignum sp. MB30-C6]